MGPTSWPPLWQYSWQNKGWQMVQAAPVCQPFALCGAKVYKTPPQRPSYFFARFPLWLAPPLSRFDFLQISTSQRFSLSVNLL